MNNDHPNLFMPLLRSLKTIYYVVYVTVFKTDIPVLTDLDSHILKSLKGPG